MRNDTPDAALIAASCHDPVQFSPIFERHADEIRRFLVRRLGRDEGGAVLGEVFRIAFERRASFRSDQPSARPWLFGIASNLVLKHRRTVARQIRATARLAVAPGTLEGFDDATISRLDAAQVFPAVAEAIALLSDADRETLLLFTWEELSYAEISEALGIPIGTVRSRLNRARQKIRELVPFDGKEPGEPTIRTTGKETR